MNNGELVKQNRKLSDFQLDREDELSKRYIEQLQEALEECASRKKNIEYAHLSSQRIYKILVYFDKLYDTMNDEDKQLFFKSLIKEIQIYEEPVGKRLNQFIL